MIIEQKYFMTNHCTKCDGTGFLPEYAGIKSGVCFKCGGRKTRTTEEIKEMKLEAKRKDKEAQKRRQEAYELPLEIEKKGKFILELMNSILDDPPQTDEEKEILKNMVARQKAKLQAMKDRLKELKEGGA